MGLSIMELCEKLKHYSAETYVGRNETAWVKSVKFLSQKRSSFESDTLYICSSPDLLRLIPPDQCINLMCVNNNHPGAYREQHSSLNFLILHKAVDLYEIYEETQDLLSKSNRVDNNSRKFLDALISNKGLQHIVDVAYEVLGNPCAVSDVNFNLLAYSKGTEINDPVLNEVIRCGYWPYHLLRYPSPYRRSYREYDEGNKPMILELGESKCRRLFGKIKINYNQVGVFAVYEGIKPFEETDIQLVEILCGVVSCEMQKNSLYNDLTEINYKKFFIDMLEGRIVEENAIQNNLKILGMKLGKKLCILSVDSRFGKRFPKPYIRTMLEQLIPNCKAVVYGEYIVAFILDATENFYGEFYFNELVKFLKENKLYAGISRCFCRLTDVRKYFLQSIKSIDLGMKMKIQNNFYDYEEYMIYNLVDTITVREAKELCHPLVTKILKYDFANNTFYAQTLYTYLSRGKNHISTADCLHIHRNTLQYRIGRIEELFGIDWDNGNLLLQIHLSFKILEYIGETWPTAAN
ncbi:MAG: helix-turn-helix domain-containing protein [Clostridiales bacterium]|jgi:hypothetical protein|nr:helix-turn-helix domain-containing protein [Eubacteriales bacterium]MDH7567269.1 helix-turn-helix domain-containing protein [Clostridiales bacterium]